MAVPKRLAAGVLGLAVVALAAWGGIAVERPVRFEGGPVVQGAWGEAEGQFGKGAGRDGLTYGPRSFAVDAAGRIYVLDWANQRLQRFDAKGKLLNLLPLVGANKASMQGSVDLAIDPKGGMWFLDNLRGRLCYFTPDGKIQELRLFGETKDALLEQAGQVAATEHGVVWSQLAVTPEEAAFQIRHVAGYGEAATSVFRTALLKTGQNGPLPTAITAAGDSIHMLLPVPGEPGAALVQQLGRDGKTIATWKAPAMAGTAGKAAELLGVDGHGRVYLGTWAKDTLHVRVYDATGLWVAHGMVAEPRALQSHIFARVDQAGNLYVAGLSDAGYQVARYDFKTGWRLRPRWAPPGTPH